MLFAIQERLEESLKALRSHAKMSHLLRSRRFAATCSFPAYCERSEEFSNLLPNLTEWRVFDHCSLMLRLYALYEDFAHNMIQEYLVFLEKHFAFSELDQKLQTNYRHGIGFIFQKMDGPRYSNIDLTSVTKNYHSALSGGSYHLEPSAMLHHDANLRYSELIGLFNRCAIPDLEAFISQSDELKEFFSEEQRQHARVDGQLAAFVQLRNEAAHTMDVSNIVSEAIQEEYIDFIKVLCAALARKIRYELTICGIEKGLYKKLGTITEIYQRGTVFIALVEGEYTLGDRLFILKEKTCIITRIRSIRYNDIAHFRLHTSRAIEIGLGVDAKCKVGDIIVSGVIDSSEIDDAPKTIEESHLSSRGL